MEQIWKKTFEFSGEYFNGQWCNGRGKAYSYTKFEKYDEIKITANEL